MLAYCWRCHAAVPEAWACIECDGIRGGTWALDECPWRGCPVDGRPRGPKRTNPLATTGLVGVFLKSAPDYESDPGDRWWRQSDYSYGVTEASLLATTATEWDGSLAS